MGTPCYIFAHLWSCAYLLTHTSTPLNVYIIDGSHVSFS